MSLIDKIQKHLLTEGKFTDYCWACGNKYSTDDESNHFCSDACRKKFNGEIDPELESKTSKLRRARQGEDPFRTSTEPGEKGFIRPSGKFTRFGKNKKGQYALHPFVAHHIEKGDVAPYMGAAWDAIDRHMKKGNIRYNLGSDFDSGVTLRGRIDPRQKAALAKVIDQGNKKGARMAVDTGCGPGKGDYIPDHVYDKGTPTRTIVNDIEHSMRTKKPFGTNVSYRHYINSLPRGSAQGNDIYAKGYESLCERAMEALTRSNIDQKYDQASRILDRINKRYNPCNIGKSDNGEPTCTFNRQNPKHHQVKNGALCCSNHITGKTCAYHNPKKGCTTNNLSCKTFLCDDAENKLPQNAKIRRNKVLKFVNRCHTDIDPYDTKLDSRYFISREDDLKQIKKSNDMRTLQRKLNILQQDKDDIIAQSMRKKSEMREDIAISTSATTSTSPTPQTSTEKSSIRYDNGYDKAAQDIANQQKPSKSRYGKPMQGESLISRVMEVVSDANVVKKQDQAIRIADKILKKHNPCGWRTENGKARCNSDMNGGRGCCHYNNIHRCDKLSDTGCTISNPECKTWLCDDAHKILKEKSSKDLKRINKVRNFLFDNDLVYNRGKTSDPKNRKVFGIYDPLPNNYESYIGMLLEALSMADRGLEAGRNRALTSKHQDLVKAYANSLANPEDKARLLGKGQDINVYGDKKWKGKSVIKFLKDKGSVSAVAGADSIETYDDKEASDFRDNVYAGRSLVDNPAKSHAPRKYQDHDKTNKPTGKTIHVSDRKLVKKYNKKLRKTLGDDYEGFLQWKKSIRLR